MSASELKGQHKLRDGQIVLLQGIVQLLLIVIVHIITSVHLKCHQGSLDGSMGVFSYLI